MKVVVYTRLWTARRSSVDGCEVPVPKDNEVLIKLHALSATPPAERHRGGTAVFRGAITARITNSAAGWRVIRLRPRGPAAAA